MMIRVRLFGPEAALLGTDSIDVQVQSPPSCAAVLDALKRTHPEINGRIAVNHAFAQSDQLIRDGDEVALIGLVSGG